jgi:hypothetical protein
VTAVRALFAGPGAVRALDHGREGAVEFVLARCAYARLGSGWLLLAEPTLPFGPLSIAVPGIERLDLRPGLPVGVADGRLSVGDDLVRRERMRVRRTPEVGFVAPARMPAVTAAGRTALAGLPEPSRRLGDGIAALVAGRIEEAVDLVAGLGEGLTPAGDDVLAGYAAARLALRGLPSADRARRDRQPALSTLAARRSSPLGLAYLRSAERGELPDAAARVLAAMCRGSLGAVRAALPSLSTWGASSGAALGWGMTAALCGGSGVGLG